MTKRNYAAMGIIILQKGIANLINSSYIGFYNINKLIAWFGFLSSKWLLPLSRDVFKSTAISQVHTICSLCMSYPSIRPQS